MKIHLSLLTKGDSEALFRFETINKEFFEEFVPPRPDSYFLYEEFYKVLKLLLEEQKENKSLFFLIKSETGKIVGRINLVDIDWVTKAGEVGYRVGKDYIGKGIAVKALEILKSEAKLFGIKRIRAKTTVDNRPSQKVLERCHFQEERVEKDDFIHYTVVL